MSLAPKKSPLEGIDTWVFDLDNTLYPRTSNLWAQIDVLITRYVMDVTGLGHDEARALQKGMYRDHGTTMNGLMARYGIDPEHYLSIVHRIDYSPVLPNPALVAAIDALPGRKLVFTNADAGHVNAVMERVGGAHLFEVVHDIRASAWEPKPLRGAYERLYARHGIDPRSAVMFDDLEKNLVVPHETGMSTVHVVPEGVFAHEAVESWELSRADNAPHVHHVTDNLAGFLGHAR